MKLNRRTLRKMILVEMFGNVHPRTEQEIEKSATAIQQCFHAILDSGPTPEIPDRPLMISRLNGIMTGEEDPERVRSSLDYRSQEVAFTIADSLGIPHLKEYIRKKAFNMIAKKYGLRRAK